MNPHADQTSYPLVDGPKTTSDRRTVTTPEADADATLLELIRDRDQAALAKLYDRHARLLYSLILRIVEDRTDAEEVMQDTFLRIWNQAGTFDPSRGVAAAWMITIARRLAIDRTRSRGHAARHREVTLEASANTPGTTVTPDHEARMEKEAQAQSVNQALGTLDSSQRDVIELAYFEGLSHGRIAERLQLPLGTVKTRIRSAMKNLRERLTPDGGMDR